MSLESSSSNVNINRESHDFYDTQIKDTFRMQTDQPNDNLLADSSSDQASNLLNFGFKSDTTLNLDPSSSDLYMFGDEDDLLKAINDDPTWSAVTQPIPTASNDTTVHSALVHTDIEDSTQNKYEVHSMELEENEFDLPSLLDIPDVTFNTQETERDNLGVGTRMDDLSGDVHTQGSLRIFDTQDTSPSILIENRDSATAHNDGFSQRMESLGLNDVSAASSSAANATNVTAPLPSVHSTTLSTSRLNGSRVTLRKRRAIQLKPFTLESAHFQKLIGRMSAKSKLQGIENIKPNLNDDDSDNDFTPSNTQVIDDDLDEILPTQGAVEYPAQKRDIKKKANPPPQAPAPQSAFSIIPARSIPKVTAVLPLTSDPIASSSRPSLLMELSSCATMRSNDFCIEYPQNLTKYGLNQLILPPSRKEKVDERSKVITFKAKKKGGSKRKQVITIGRLKEPVINQDIFAFDLHPRATFSQLPIPTISSNIPNSENGGSVLNISTSILNDVNTSLAHDDGNEQEKEDQEEDEDEEIVIQRRPIKRKKRLGLDSDEDDISEREEEVRLELTEEELDAIYKFPSAPCEPPSRHQLITPLTEDDVVPIVDDGFEYRENKRQRMGIKDIKKKALKSVLPASFLKIYEKDLLEEQQRKRQVAASNRKRPTKISVVQRSASSASGSIYLNSTNTTRRRDTEDVFAAFREESQSEDSDDGFDRDSNGTNNNIEESFDDDGHGDYDGGYDDMDVDTTIDDIINSPSPARSQINNTSRNANPPLAPIFQNVRRTESRSNTNAGPTSSLPTRRRHILKPTYPVGEAMEDNRIPGQRSRSSATLDTNNASSTSRRAPHRTTRSSIAIVRPSNKKQPNQNWIQINHNPTPVRRRKRPKRSTDDIYIHAPYFAGQCKRYISKQQQQYGTSDMPYEQLMPIGDLIPRRAFDDIFIGTKRQAMMYKNHSIYIGNYNIDDYLLAVATGQQQQQKQEEEEEEEPTKEKWTVSSLQNTIKRVRGLFDYDLRRVMGLKDTVYLHHRLFEPLLSATPNTSRVYAQFKETHAELRLFGRFLFWQHIQTHEKDMIKNLFAKVFRDLLDLCITSNNNLRATLEEEHDYFYIFVSICLTQWIPHLVYEAQVQMTELFANAIRGLAYLIYQLVEKHKHPPWRPLVKTMLFILDWTCRLHHLGIARSVWSVTECIQLMMDMLVSMGYQSIRDTPFVVEAWICLIQIMSVSSRQGGYYFNEQVFLNQMTDSIKRKSKGADAYEYEKRKTTRIWAEHLDYILDKHIMLL